MKGYKSAELGLIPLSVAEIFERAHDKEVDICCSYIEIYNESVNDLLDAANKNLDIRESIARGIYINKLSERKVSNAKEVLQLMAQGDEQRSIAATNLNEVSSRGHTVFRINISQRASGNKLKLSQLNLVDLAGSEGVQKTQAQGIRLREG